jgi:hypothetical protein
MNNQEILASALRWHTTHQRRLAASAKLYEHKKAKKQSTGYFSSDYQLSLKVTEARRLERAALRQLAKLCEVVRGSQIDDAAEVGTFIDVPCKLISSSSAQQ